MQDPFPTLYRDGDYVIEHHYENCYFSWPGGGLDLGDHYGDPTCGLINASEGWCLSGGEGLVISLFPHPLTAECRPTEYKRLNLWRRENPPSAEHKCWFVQGAWLKGGDVARVLVDPLSGEAGLYDVDVRTLQWRKV
jgi:hypothetical protein